MFKACQLAEQYFETSIRVKRQCEMGLTEVVSHKTLQLVYWVRKVVADVLTPFSTQLSGNLAIQTTPFLFLSFFNSFSPPHFTCPENWAKCTSVNWWHELSLLSCFTLKKLNLSCLHCARYRSPIWSKPWDVLPVAGFQHQRSRPSFGVTLEPLELRWQAERGPNPTMSSADSISVGFENETTNR